jgi:dihydrofolate reductase
VRSALGHHGQDGLPAGVRRLLSKPLAKMLGGRIGDDEDLLTLLNSETVAHHRADCSIEIVCGHAASLCTTARIRRVAKTQYFCAATLDGYIADADDGIDWLTGFESSYEGPGEAATGGYDLFMEGVGALVMGSSTYEFILGHDWPYGDRPSWVLTTRDLPDTEGADIRFHNGPVADIHDEMVAAAGDRNLWVVGGGPVASDLVDAGLLDELLLTVVPIVLGSGKPLFSRPIERPMTLHGTRPYANGMVELSLSLRR